MSIQQQGPLKIGYYPIRGKAQVPRLLCEYLAIPYEDQLFELQEWDKFKREEAKDWDFADLPFLKDGDFIVTEAFPICEYLLERAGAKELLGRNISDQAIVQMYLWTIDTMGGIISINCSKVPEPDRASFREAQWKNNVLPRMMKYEQFVRGDEWFLDYITIIDFSIYELMRYMEMLFPGKQSSLPKLMAIMDRVGQLPAIKGYEESERAVREMDPSVLLKRLKGN